MTSADIRVICAEFARYIEQNGSAKKMWYVGITSDVQKRLHQDHQVPEENHRYIWREAASSAAAREIEKAFLNLGCDGGSGGGDHNTRFVYAYLKTSVTNP